MRSKDTTAALYPLAFGTDTLSEQASAPSNTLVNRGSLIMILSMTNTRER